MIATQNSRFEQIVRETQAKLRAYIAGMGIGVDDIDDLTQDVYLAFYRDMEKMPPDVETVAG